MRKKLIAMITMAVLAVTSLTACGGPKKADYEKDLEVLTQAADVIDNTDFDSDESFTDKIKSYSCKTEEGKVLLADFVAMGEIYDEMKTEMSKDDYDVDALNSIMDRLKAMQDSFEQHTNAFKDAATAIGVDASNFETGEDAE